MTRDFIHFKNISNMSKKAIIKRLSLVNFKGLRNVVIDFNDTVTTISGRNGTGKTTIMDAFTWLLWGKDSEGNVAVSYTHLTLPTIA